MEESPHKVSNVTTHYFIFSSPNIMSAKKDLFALDVHQLLKDTTNVFVQLDRLLNFCEETEERKLVNEAKEKLGVG